MVQTLKGQQLGLILRQVRTVIRPQVDLCNSLRGRCGVTL